MNINILPTLLWGMTISLLVIGKPLLAISNFFIVAFVIAIMSIIKNDSSIIKQIEDEIDDDENQ
jgi:hypothetical protein